MAQPARPLSRYRQLRWCRPVVVSWFCLLLGACAQQPSMGPAVASLPPLQFEGEVVSVADAGSVQEPDLLAIDDEMRNFVEHYVGTGAQPRTRLLNLHGAVKGSGMLGMRYDPYADGSASEVFHLGAANCLSYAHLFVALAREAGLDARYQWVEVRPEWTLLGERVALRLHVNVVVRLPGGEQYMVDIDPLPSQDVADSRTISDADALALYHNNLAMEALAAGDLAEAWRREVRALQLSPDMGHLWVNLGAVYRTAGQYSAAERSYFVALQLDERDRSAMNNLMVLYEREGRDSEQAYWEERVVRYRETNPYYHAWLGDEASENGAWDEALEHYQRALQLRADDSRLLYAVGIIQYQRGDFVAATDYIGRAIDTASLRGEVEDYRLKLEAIRREALATR